jgi:hypothetical protein
MVRLIWNAIDYSICLSQLCKPFQFFIVELGYFDCIQSRTELNGWLRKQEVKGPPDVMYGKGKTRYWTVVVLFAS